MEQVQGSTVATVRQARGLTQADLAKHAQMSQALLSKLEAGAATVDEARAAALAAELEVTPETLTTRLDDVVAGCTHFRKRASLKVSHSTQLRAELAVRAHVLSRVRDLAGDTRLTVRRQPLTADSYDSPEEIARRVRSNLYVTAGPIENLFEVIESAGCMLSSIDEPGLAFDAASVWAANDSFVTMLINTGRPTDRIRFSTAHELGHAVMHSVPSQTTEQEADRFASEFLMPASDIEPDLTDLNFTSLASLKSKWQVSMAALIRRGYDLGAIGDRRYRSLSIELSKAGYRKNEPITLTPEAPTAAATLLHRLESAGTPLHEITAHAGLLRVNQLLDITGTTHSEAP